MSTELDSKLDLSKPIFVLEKKAGVTHDILVKYVGLTRAAVRFVTNDIHDPVEPFNMPRTWTTSVVLMDDLLGEPLYGWNYGATQRYREQIQRMPWDGNTVHVYTFLRDMETGKKLFLWERGWDEKLIFNYDTGRFSR